MSTPKKVRRCHHCGSADHRLKPQSHGPDLVCRADYACMVRRAAVERAERAAGKAVTW